jgi:hypothetical protein
MCHFDTPQCYGWNARITHLCGLVSLVLALFITTLHPSPIMAASSGLSISPPFQQITLSSSNPQLTYSLVLTNSTAVELTLKLTTVDFGTLDETGGVVFAGSKETELEKKYGLAAWMNLGNDLVTLAPHTSQSIEVTLDNRINLAPGGHYGAVLATTQSLDNHQAPGRGEQVTIQQTLSSLIFLKKLGGEQYGLLLKETYRDGGFLLPSKLQLRYQNPGNIHVVPRGIISVTDPLGKVVEQGIINTDSSLILPESFRVLQVKLRPQSVPWWPGIYHQVIQYRYDGITAFTTDSSTFFYPGYLIILLVGFALIGGGVYWTARHLERRNMLDPKIFRRS